MWTDDDVPLLDEARALLGPRPLAQRLASAEEIRTYGHIVVDEAQDLSPMQLRMLTRRSLNGSMTVVGDIAQAPARRRRTAGTRCSRTCPIAARSRAELTVGYRIPAPNMALAARVLRGRRARPSAAAIGSRRRRSPPLIRRAAPDELGGEVAVDGRDELDDVGDGNVAVIVPGSLVDAVARRARRPPASDGRAHAPRPRRSRSRSSRSVW